MTFRDKIDKILKIKEIKLYKLAELSGLGNTLEKAYEDNREMRTSTTDRFIQKMSINSIWWKTQKGEVFIEKGTDDQEPGDNKENDQDMEPVLKELIERNDKYRLVPTIILDKYEILSNRELDSREKLLQKLLDQAEEISATKQFLLDEKDKLIGGLEAEIAELRTKLKQGLSAQNT